MKFEKKLNFFINGLYLYTLTIFIKHNQIKGNKTIICAKIKCSFNICTRNTIMRIKFTFTFITTFVLSD